MGALPLLPWGVIFRTVLAPLFRGKQWRAGWYCVFFKGRAAPALLTELHCFASWFRRFSDVSAPFLFYGKVLDFLSADSQPSSTSPLSKCCVGGACNIYLGFIVGQLAGSHRLRSVPVGLTECLPDGKKVLSSDFRSADIFILAVAYALMPPALIFPKSHPKFFFFFTHFLALWLFLPSLLSSQGIWLMPPDPPSSLGSCRTLLCFNADMNHGNLAFCAPPFLSAPVLSPAVFSLKLCLYLSWSSPPSSFIWPAVTSSFLLLLLELLGAVIVDSDRGLLLWFDGLCQLLFHTSSFFFFTFSRMFSAPLSRPVDTFEPASSQSAF